MPEKRTVERARQDKRAGKARTTQAGEFVREEMEHVKKGKHGVKSRKQAIAIGLSKARRAGVDLEPPRGGKRKTRQSAASARRAGQKSGALRGTKSKSGSKSRSTSSARSKKSSSSSRPSSRSRKKR